ncbi:MAG: hypothetical protein HOK28_10870 [Deltaproteobacteria bacterium]|nr:hypothetical protein [Deltaproteobacteria bacterium]
MLYRLSLVLVCFSLTACFGAEATVQFETNTTAKTMDNLELGDGGCITNWVADGWCDFGNNREECSWDGGDCCPSTCPEDAQYSCGDYAWDCQEPSACENTGDCEPAPEPDDANSEEQWCEQFPEFCDDIDDCEQFPEICNNNGGSWGSESECIDYWNSDGWCDPENNSEVCGWDGGDCCPSTCEDTEFICGDYGWYCEDPAACENTGECDPVENGQGDSYDYPDSGCIDNWVADGWCDPENNNEECGWDGGDCCSSTCEDSDYICGHYGWDCEDPTACENTGECDPTENTDSDSEPNNSFDEWCEQFPEICDTIDDCEQFPEECGDNGNSGDVAESDCSDYWSGDGWCDPSNNTETCGWDGGDCCASTCPESAQFICGNFSYECQDPEACENNGGCDPAP